MLISPAFCWQFLFFRHVVLHLRFREKEKKRGGGKRLKATNLKVYLEIFAKVLVQELEAVAPCPLHRPSRAGAPIPAPPARLLAGPRLGAASVPLRGAP